jgi:hypothetical protein
MYEAKARQAAGRLALAQEARARWRDGRRSLLGSKGESERAPAWMADEVCRSHHGGDFAACNAFEYPKNARGWWASRLGESGEILLARGGSPRADLASLKEVEAGRPRSRSGDVGGRPAVFGRRSTVPRLISRPCRRSSSRRATPPAGCAKICVACGRDLPRTSGRRIEELPGTFLRAFGGDPRTGRRSGGRPPAARLYRPRGRGANSRRRSSSDALTSLQRQLGDSTTRLVELRGTRLTRLLFLEREERVGPRYRSLDAERTRSTMRGACP